MRNWIVRQEREESSNGKVTVSGSKETSKKEKDEHQAFGKPLIKVPLLSGNPITQTS